MSIRKRLELLLRSERSARRQANAPEAASPDELGREARSVLDELLKRDERLRREIDALQSEADRLEKEAADALRYDDEPRARELLKERYYLLQQRDERHRHELELRRNADELRDTLESYHLEELGPASDAHSEPPAPASYYGAAREAWASSTYKRSVYMRAAEDRALPRREDPLRTWSSGEWSEREADDNENIAYTQDDVGVGFETTRDPAAPFAGSGLDESFSRFNEMADKIGESELRADVARELAPGAEGRRLAAEIDTLQRARDIETMKKSLRQRTQGADKHERPAEDALSRLQRRLGSGDD